MSKLPVVAVIMGSKSDAEKVRPAEEILSRLGVGVIVAVISAHRQPAKLHDFVEQAPGKGVEVFIAAAGKAAALPGVVASLTILPVIGVPISTRDLGGARFPPLHRADAQGYPGGHGGGGRGGERGSAGGRDSRPQVPRGGGEGAQASRDTGRGRLMESPGIMLKDLSMLIGRVGDRPARRRGRGA